MVWVVVVRGVLVEGKVLCQAPHGWELAWCSELEYEEALSSIDKGQDKIS